MAKRTLNDRIIKAIKPAPAGKRREVWDALVPGLGLRTTETGAKTFVLATRYPGRSNPARRALGGYGELTLEQARGKARAWLSLIDRGIDPAEEEERKRLAEQRKRAGTFASVAEEFITDKVRHERQGVEGENILRKIFIPAWGARSITDIKPLDVLNVIRPLKSTPYWAHNVLGTIKRLFSWAIDQHAYGLEMSPCDRLKPKAIIGERKARTRVLSDDEVRAFWRATGRMGYPYGTVGQMLLLTGQRHCDVSEAPRAEFNITEKVWTISAERFKSKEAHTVPLTDDVLAVLDGLPRFKQGDFLFSASFGRKPLYIRADQKHKLDARMLRTLRAMARKRGENPDTIELKPWVIHDLRRVVRSHLAALRIPDHIAEMVIGHGRKGLARVYDRHRYHAEVREALQLWAGRLRSIVEPAPANVVELKTRAS
jgi:Arm DNA-binding domain/Phage integrase family